MKKPFYDIIPNEKRSIRNIPLNKKSEISMDGIRMSAPKHVETQTEKHAEKKHNLKETVRSEIMDEEEMLTSDLNEEESFEEWRRSKKDSYWRAWVVLCVLFIAGIAVYSIFFGSAVITINPIKHDLVLKETNISLNLIKHEELSTELEASEEVTANGTVKIDRKAIGKIVLYNAFNSSSQKLVGGTRLETPNGLVYKLKSTVIIPAQKTVSGKKVPGSVDAEVEASETGEKYNQGFKDFNIVAYKGSDRYDTIYGRSKTALANGFSGTIPNILTKDIDTATANIKDKITKDADDYFAKQAKVKGDTFVYIPTTKKVTYSNNKQEVSKNGKTATIKISAKVTTILFESTALFEQIIKKQNDLLNATSTTEGTTTEKDLNEIIYTGDPSKLKVSLNEGDDISISGTTTISSIINLPKVTKAVSGLSREQAIGAIKRLVELETIEIDIRPWWNKKLPSSDKIKIRTEE